MYNIGKVAHILSVEFNLPEAPRWQWASIVLRLTWAVSGRPRLDPRWPKTLPGDSEAGGDFGGHLAPASRPILFRFLSVSSCGPGLLQVCGLKPGRGSCLHSVYQDGKHVNARSICSQDSPFGWCCRNSNPVAKGKCIF